MQAVGAQCWRICWPRGGVSRMREKPLLRTFAASQEAANGPIQDASTRLRIESLRNEVKALEEQMEKDDAFVDAWRATRKELKELEQAGVGLERSRYDGLFRQATKWCAPIENATNWLTKWMPA
jgi:hypothetical protein